MADLTHFIPFKMSLPDDVVTSDPRTGEMDINLSTMPSAESVAAAQADATQALADASDAQAAADLAVDATKIVRLPIYIPSIQTPTPIIQVPVPGDGTLTSFKFAASGQPEAADATITAGQTGVPMTGGTATLTPTDPAGIVATATPSSGNTFADGTCMEFEVGGTNITDAPACVVVTYTLD